MVPVSEHNMQDGMRCGLVIFACLLRNKIFSLEYEWELLEYEYYLCINKYA